MTQLAARTAIGETAEPWRSEPDQVAAALGTDLEEGPVPGTARASLEVYGPNRLEGEAAIPAWRRFLAEFADPLIYLLGAAVVVSVGAWWLEGAERFPSTQSSSAPSC